MKRQFLVRHFLCYLLYEIYQIENSLRGEEEYERILDKELNEEGEKE